MIGSSREESPGIVSTSVIEYFYFLSVWIWPCISYIVYIHCHSLMSVLHYHLKFASVNSSLDWRPSVLKDEASPSIEELASS